MDTIRNRLFTPWKFSIVQFAGVGAVSTTIDFIVLNAVYSLTGNSYVAAGIGFLAGATNGYFMNSRWVFGHDYNPIQYRKYFFVSFIGLLITEFIVHFLHVKYEGMPLNGAKMVAVGVVFLWNYVVSKWLTFN